MGRIGGSRFAVWIYQGFLSERYSGFSRRRP